MAFAYSLAPLSGAENALLAEISGLPFADFTDPVAAERLRAWMADTFTPDETLAYQQALRDLACGQGCLFEAETWQWALLAPPAERARALLKARQLDRTPYAAPPCAELLRIIVPGAYYVVRRTPPQRQPEILIHLGCSRSLDRLYSRLTDDRGRRRPEFAHCTVEYGQFIRNASDAYRIVTAAAPDPS